MAQLQSYVTAVKDKIEDQKYQYLKELDQSVYRVEESRKEISKLQADLEHATDLAKSDCQNQYRKMLDDVDLKFSVALS